MVWIPSPSRQIDWERVSFTTPDLALLVDRHPVDPAFRIPVAQQAATVKAASNDRNSANHRKLTMREFFRGWKRKVG